MFDVWNEDNAIVKEEYKKDNYIINSYDNDSNLVAIYFSSNGLWYPNTEERFRQRVIKENRFEWQHHKIPYVKKEMYFRDIYKSWYITGINERIDDVEKLITFIKNELPLNARVVTVGNSAGGYMAALVGTLIGADWVLDFSGQNSLILRSGKETFVERYLDDNKRSQYYDLCKVWEKYKKPPIFYFWAVHSDFDQEQYGLIKGMENIYAFGFDTKIHSKTMYNFNLDAIMAMDKEKIMQLYYNWGGKKIKRVEFSIKVCGVWNTLIGLGRQALKKFF